MLKSLYLYFILLLFSTLLLSGCDDNEAEPSKTDLLTASTWTGYTVYLNGDDITQDLKQNHNFDITKYTLLFTRSGSFTEDYKGKKYEGKWEFRNTEQEIVYDKGTPQESISKITKLDKQELYLLDELEYEGKPALFEFRYKR